jgi:hypothetical protein
MTAFSLKATGLLLVLWQVAAQPVATPDHLRYERVVNVSGGQAAASGQSCAVLDAEVFAHASAALKDVRLYREAQVERHLVEVPYATTLSETLQQESEDARVLNLGERSGRIVFDLEMPHRAYTTVTLDLGAKDFIATATVRGESAPGSAGATALGSFTLFDLTAQHLSHSTSLPLAESSFPYLHVELAMSPAPGVSSSGATLRDPGIVKSASVPPSREAQTIYTTIAQTATLTQRGRQSVATFQMPLRVPIERISFVVAKEFKGNFSREVEIKAHAVPGEHAVAGSKRNEADDSDVAPEEEGPPHDETLAGTISRVHETEGGRELAEENLSLAAVIGSNMQRPAVLEVAIDNGDDQPLPITSVKLEMRQRKICFDATGGEPLVLYYGDAALEAPVYDYAKLFHPVATPLAASLGEETLNASYRPRSEAKPFTERHPELLWIGLLIVVGILAVTAIRSAKKIR